MTSIGLDIGSTTTRAWVRGEDVQSEPSASATVTPKTPDLLLHLGDPTPLIVDGVAKNVTTVLGEVLDEALQAVSAVADRRQPVVVAVPTAWGTTRQEQVRDALASIGADSVEIVSSAEAVVSMLVRSAAGCEDSALSGASALTDGLIAVVDLGGHSTAGAVVRSSAGTVSLVGEPDGEESLGGLDLDQVVREQLATKVGDDDILACWPQDVRPSSVPDVAAGLRLVRERLSRDDAVVVDVALSTSGTSVVVTAAEFAASAAPVLERMAGIAGDLVTATADEVSDVAPDSRCVVLIGGVAHTPGLADAVRARTDWPVVVPPHPELVAVRSAAGWLPEAPHDATGILELEANVDLLGRPGEAVGVGDDGDSTARSEWARARPKIAAGVALGTAALIAYTLNTDAGSSQQATRAPDVEPGAFRASASPTPDDVVNKTATSPHVSQSTAAVPHLSAGSADDTDTYVPAGDAPSTATTATPPTGGKTATAETPAAGRPQPGTTRSRQAPNTATRQSGVGTGQAQANPGFSDSLQQLAADLFSGKTDRSGPPRNTGTPDDSSSQDRTSPSLPDLNQQIADAVANRKGGHTPKHARGNSGERGSGSADQSRQSQAPNGMQATGDEADRAETSRARAARQREAAARAAKQAAQAAVQRAADERAAEKRAEAREQRAAEQRAAEQRAAEQRAAKLRAAKPTAAQLEQQRQAKKFYANLDKLSPQDRANAGQFFKNLADMSPAEREQAQKFFAALAEQNK